MLPLISFLAGTYLGLRFSIFMLVPFSALGAGALISSSEAAGHGFFDTLRVLLFYLVSIQAGYMVGLTARDLRVRIWNKFRTALTNRV